MNIVDNRKRGCEFQKLRIGDCFMKGNDLYIAIEDAVIEEDACDCYDDANVKNALNLENGLLVRFNDLDIVELVDVEITVS